MKKKVLGAPLQPDLWRHFLHLGSLLSDDSSVCQVDVKLSSTVHICLSLLKQFSSLHPSNIFFYLLIPWGLIPLTNEFSVCCEIFPLREGKTRLSPPHKVPMTNQSLISLTLTLGTPVVYWVYLERIGKGLLMEVWTTQKQSFWKFFVQYAWGLFL